MRDSVSNHQPRDCLFNCLFKRRSRKHQSPRPSHWALCGEFTGDRWIPRTKGQLRGKSSHLMTSSWTELVPRNIPLQIHRNLLDPMDCNDLMMIIVYYDSSSGNDRQVKCLIITTTRSSVRPESKYHYFHSRKCIWNCHLRIVSYLVQSPMRQYLLSKID